MKTSLEEINPVKKKLFVEIESQEVDKKLNEAYKKLGKKAKIPGFRPGKVPRKILQTHFGTQVAEDVTRNLINETFPKAIREVETSPLNTHLLEKDTLKQKQNFKYSAIIEVRPKFEVKNYLGIDLEKEKCTITEEDVQNNIEKIRKANGKLVSLNKERPIRKDDYIILDYEGFEGDQPLDGIKATNFLLKVGSNDFHPKFEESFIGLNKEDKPEIKVDFEESYFHSKLAGKNVNFKVRIIDIKEMILPELNDDFVQGLGADFKDLEDMKNKVLETITTEEEKRVDRELRQRLLQKISESLDFILPNALVESELDYAVENVKQNMIRRGSSIEKMGLSETKLRTDFKPASEKRVKEMLILGEIAKHDNISITEDDLAKGYKDLALSSGQSLETVRKYYEAGNLVDSLRETLLEEKTLNYLVEHASITEVEKGELSQNISEEKEIN